MSTEPTAPASEEQVIDLTGTPDDPMFEQMAADHPPQQAQPAPQSLPPEFTDVAVHLLNELNEEKTRLNARITQLENKNLQLVVAATRLKGEFENAVNQLRLAEAKLELRTEDRELNRNQRRAKKAN